MADRKRAEYCSKLATVTPGTLDYIYLVSGGSEAVETAFKIARQAQLNRGLHEKYKIISHYDSYHGMTLATQGVSMSPASQRRFEPMLPKWPSVRTVLGLRPT